MLRRFVNYIQRPPPIPAAYIDGTLYVLIALFSALSGVCGSDEAAKWISPVALFYARSFVVVTSACVVALKLFRSTSFAEHRAGIKSQEAPGVETVSK